jgi:hypothetical protein
MVVLVNVGRWRLTSDGPTVGLVTIVYRSIFFIPTSMGFKQNIGTPGQFFLAYSLIMTFICKS